MVMIGAAIGGVPYRHSVPFLIIYVVDTDDRAYPLPRLLQTYPFWAQVPPPKHRYPPIDLCAPFVPSARCARHGLSTTTVLLY